MNHCAVLCRKGRGSCNHAYALLKDPIPYTRLFRRKTFPFLKLLTDLELKVFASYPRRALSQALYAIIVNSHHLSKHHVPLHLSS